MGIAHTDLHYILEIAYIRCIQQWNRHKSCSVRVFSSSVHKQTSKVESKNRVIHKRNRSYDIFDKHAAGEDAAAAN